LGSFTFQTDEMMNIRTPSLVPAAAAMLLTVAWLVSCGSPTAPLPDLSIVTQSVPDAIRLQPYQATVEATGGNGQYTWTHTAGSLPPGITLGRTDAGQGMLSGTPQEAGHFTFTLRAQSGDGQTSSRTFTIVVDASLSIVTASLPPAFLGSVYSEAIHAAGGDGEYDWAVTAGELPPGLELGVDDQGQGDQAIISGMPEDEGVFTFTVTVTTGDGDSASRQFTITVSPQLPLAVETPAVPPALVEATYDVQLTSTGGGAGPVTWAIVEGSLPPGLTMTSAGRIQGTPTTPVAAAFTVEARTPEGETVRRTFQLEAVENRTGEFNITIFPVAPVPSGILPHLEKAVADWEAAVTGNLPSIPIRTSSFDPSGCGGFIRLADGTSVDDVMIIVSIEPIDGPGGVLGRAGPCLIRTSGRLPLLGVVILDADDLASRIGDQELTHIISHEIGHVLGFGTLWTDRSLLAGGGGSDPRFLGTNAVREYNDLGGSGNVPVENTGGSGTRDSHWRKSVFGTERMTGYSAGPGVFQPLSRVSIASLLDLGYVVDLSAADAYSLPSAMEALPEGFIPFREILLEPIGTVDPDGRTRRLDPR
jgi:hypothetical protein